MSRPDQPALPGPAGADVSALSALSSLRCLDLGASNAVPADTQAPGLARALAGLPHLCTRKLGYWVAAAGEEAGDMLQVREGEAARGWGRW